MPPKKKCNCANMLISQVHFQLSRLHAHTVYIWHCVSLWAYCSPMIIVIMAMFLNVFLLVFRNQLCACIIIIILCLSNGSMEEETSSIPKNTSILPSTGTTRPTTKKKKLIGDSELRGCNYCIPQNFKKNCTVL